MKKDKDNAPSEKVKTLERRKQLCASVEKILRQRKQYLLGRNLNERSFFIIKIWEYFRYFINHNACHNFV